MRNIERPASVQNIVDGIARFKTALDNRHISLRVQEAKYVLPFHMMKQIKKRNRLQFNTDISHYFITIPACKAYTKREPIISYSEKIIG